MKAVVHKFSHWVRLENFEGAARHLKNVVTEIIKKSGHSIVGFSEYEFGPEAYSATWLVAESHVALHTWPEHEAAYVELSSCSADKFLVFISLFEHEFNCTVKFTESTPW